MFTDDEVTQLVEALRTGMLPKTWATRRAHVAALKERHASTTICAKCGGELVKRTTKTGPKAGRSFLGCANYPKCRHTVAIAEEATN